MKKPFLETLGWYGVAAIVGAYALLTLEIVALESTTYLLLNLTGSAAILFHSWIKKDYQPVVINAVWLVLSLIAFAR